MHINKREGNMINIKKIKRNINGSLVLMTLYYEINSAEVNLNVIRIAFLRYFMISLLHSWNI